MPAPARCISRAITSRSVVSRDRRSTAGDRRRQPMPIGREAPFIEIITIIKLPESYANFHSTASPSTDHRWTRDPQMATVFRQNCRGLAVGLAVRKAPGRAIPPAVGPGPCFNLKARFCCRFAAGAATADCRRNYLLQFAAAQGQARCTSPRRDASPV
jgi:hypothetical protein